MLERGEYHTTVPTPLAGKYAHVRHCLNTASRLCCCWSNSNITINSLHTVPSNMLQSYGGMISSRTAVDETQKWTNLVTLI